MSEQPWQGHTPTAEELEGMPLEWFHNAVDELVEETLDGEENA
jgi:hypothetical protein